MDHKDFALQFAKKAGNIIRESFALGIKKEWKVDATPVTEVDLGVNRLLIQQVKEYFPEGGFGGRREL
ncbi:MAG: hypothetical protein PHN39_00785 [Candidatus Pacebacteria bacterium]|nr:hypothetical protein [Candidatus Paceibacterota bacterium]